MRETELFKLPALYRDDFRITGYRFGQGEKALAVVGSLRGNEYQQIYMCSLLMRRLRQLEEAGELCEDREILVIPSLNPYSMNIGRRFWPTDNTDVNRMFPGYSLGETTQRIAAGVFDKVSKYRRGIQFASFYMPGRYLPHVHIMQTGFEQAKKAESFGLPYIVLRRPRPYDTTTLNYNWQIWETEAYSLYSSTTAVLDPVSGKQVVESVLRYMRAEGLLRGEAKPAQPSEIISDAQIVSVRPEKAGLFRPLVQAGDPVRAGEKLACIQDVYLGDTLEELTSPCDGIVFFVHDEPLTYANTAVCKIIRRTP